MREVDVHPMMDDLILIGDEAFTREELERMLRRRNRERERHKEYVQQPEVRERRRVYYREYQRRRYAERPYRKVKTEDLEARIERARTWLDKLLDERQRRAA